jgi:hypothetical protein
VLVIALLVLAVATLLYQWRSGWQGLDILDAAEPREKEMTVQQAVARYHRRRRGRIFEEMSSVSVLAVRALLV